MTGNTEEYMRQVTIGDLVPHDATIFLAAYDPAWPLAYEGSRAASAPHSGAARSSSSTWDPRRSQASPPSR